jgi:hypothetical protein
MKTLDSQIASLPIDERHPTPERAIPNVENGSVGRRVSVPSTAPSEVPDSPADSGAVERSVERSTSATTRIHALCDLLDNPDVTAAQVSRLLADQGVQVSDGHVRKTVTKWKADRAVNSSDASGRNERTADLPRLTDEEMARMEAEMAAVEAGIAITPQRAHLGERAMDAPAGQEREQERSSSRATDARTASKRSTSRAIVPGSGSELAAEVAAAR